jgi:hypothetical protein
LLVVVVVEVLQVRLVEMVLVRALTALSRMVVEAAVPIKLLGELAPRVVVAAKTVTLHLVRHLRDTEAEMDCRLRFVLQPAAVAVQEVSDCKVSRNAALKRLGEVTAVSALPTQSLVCLRITAAAAAAVRTITPVRLLNLDVVETAAAGTGLTGIV